MIIFEKVYDGESICDMDRDICEAFLERYNPEMKEVPRDEYGFCKGTFTLKVEWKEWKIDEN